MKLNLLLFVMILFSVSTFALLDCDLRGNHYYCEDGDTVSGELDLVDKGISITDMDITISGSGGSTSSCGTNSGSDGIFKIITTGRVFINNTNFTITGGNGASSNGCPGGAGGDAIFNISGSTNSQMSDVNISLTGGLGAAGKDGGDAGWYSGGAGGSTYYALESIIETSDLEVTLIGSSGGSGDTECDSGDDFGAPGA